MTVTNTGGDSFDFQAALHSYFDLSVRPAKRNEMEWNGRNQGTEKE
jgi:hypothetical protein